MSVTGNECMLVRSQIYVNGNLRDVRQPLQQKEGQLPEPNFYSCPISEYQRIVHVNEQTRLNLSTNCL